MAARNTLAAFSFLLPFAILGRLGPLGDFLFAYWGCLGVAFAAYWYACVEGKAGLSVTHVLLIGLIARLLVLPMPPSDDIHRYIWEGKVLSHGFNPWRLAPDHPYLAFLRDADWARINHPHIASIYPPLAQALFWILSTAGGSFILFKLGFIACEGLAWAAMRAAGGTGARALGICFLNPLLIFEVAGRGHYDSLPMTLNLAFFAWLARPGSALLLGAGALAKVTSFALAPLILYRHGWKRALAWWAALGAIVGATLWAVGAFDVLNRFATRFRFNGALPSLIDYGLPFLSAPSRRLILALAFLAAAGTALWLLRKAEPARQALGFMGLVLLFSPTLHPWYLLWILPFAALAGSRPWLLLTATSLISYEVYARQPWGENPWLRLPVYLPPLALWAWLAWRERRAA